LSKLSKQGVALIDSSRRSYYQVERKGREEARESDEKREVGPQKDHVEREEVELMEYFDTVADSDWSRSWG